MHRFSTNCGTFGCRGATHRYERACRQVWRQATASRWSSWPHCGLIVRDGFSTPTRDESVVHGYVDRLFDELHRSIDEGVLCAIGMQARWTVKLPDRVGEHAAGKIGRVVNR